MILPAALLLTLVRTTPDPEIVDLVAMRGGHCALRDDGRVVCWGGHRSFPALLGLDDTRPDRPERLEAPTLVPNLPPCKAIALGIQGWCVTEADALASWGRGSEVDATKLGTVTDVVAVHTTTCVRTRDGTVTCWDPVRHDGGTWALRTTSGAALPPGDLRPGAELDTLEIHGADAAFRVEIDDAPWVRGGAEQRVRVEPISRVTPSWAEALAQRRLGARMPDAVVRGQCMLAQHRVWCWPGTHDIGWTPRVLGTADVLALSDDWACLGRGSAVRCHRRAGGEHSFELGAAVTMVQLGERSGLFGAADGRVIVVGLAHDPRAPVPPAVTADVRVRGTPVMATKDGERVCVFVREGTRECVGDDAGSTKIDGVAIGVDRGRAMVRMSDGRIVEVKANGDLATAHKTSDAAFTMGNDRTAIFDGREILVHGGPGGVGNWLEPADLAGHAPARDRPSVTSNDLQTCVLDRAGVVHCSQPIPGIHGGSRLPLRTTKWTTEVALGGPAVAIVAAEASVCARLGNGEVACWGQRYGGDEGLDADGEITQTIARAR